MIIAVTIYLTFTETSGILGIPDSRAISNASNAPFLVSAKRKHPVISACTFSNKIVCSFNKLLLPVLFLQIIFSNYSR